MIGRPSRQWELPTLTTDRLVLRPVEAGDLALMVALNSDPAVMTFIRGRPATPDESATEWRQRLDHQSDPRRGLGYWAGFQAGAFVGWWSASSFEGRPDISGIGYRLHATGWGRGLATEGAKAMIRQAFICREIDRVFASTMTANTGSCRVLEKLGMMQTASKTASQDKQDIPGWEHGEVTYELTRTEWEGVAPNT